MAIASDIRFQHPAVLVLRYVTAILMLFHGVPKLFRGVGGIEKMLAEIGMPEWFAFGVFIGEIVAPLLVMAGLWVRWAALLMVVNMIFAVALAHPNDFLVLTPSGAWRLELQAFFFFNSLVIAWLANGKSARARYS